MITSSASASASASASRNSSASPWRIAVADPARA
jgi:hypothetical protein